MPAVAPRRKRRRSKSSSLPRFALVAAAALLIGAGFYLGFRVAQPPPPPDFDALRQAAEADAAAAARARRVADAAPASPSIPLPVAADPGDPGAAVAEAERPAAEAPGDADRVVRTRQPAPGADGRPRLAIVVDDLGRSLDHLEVLGHLGVPLTYAVLPYETRTAEVVAELRRRGAEIFLHLPMEAKGGANPGPGALRVTMSEGELRRATLEALDAVPGAIGVNNHMGSAVAADRQSMAAVLGVIEGRGLAFIDSRTSADTLGYTLARQLGIRAAERQVFLDTRRDRDFIRGQFRELLREARERGGAIAICHPYAETLEILAAEVPRAKAEGFEFVPASQLLDG